MYWLTAACAIRMKQDSVSMQQLWRKYTNDRIITACVHAPYIESVLLCFPPRAAITCNTRMNYQIKSIRKHRTAKLLFGFLLRWPILQKKEYYSNLDLKYSGNRSAISRIDIALVENLYDSENSFEDTKWRHCYKTANWKGHESVTELM